MLITQKNLFAAMLLAGALGAFGCAGNEKKDGEEIGGGGGGGEKDDDGKHGNVSKNRVTLSNSWSNNPLTSQTINKGKADSQADSLGGKDVNSLEGKISAERLAGKGIGSVMSTAKKLAEAVMEKKPNDDIDDDVKLDVALAAIGSRNFALAEHFLDELIDSKNARVKAGALNAFGVIALKDDRVPEAVVYFKAALKASSGYKPALLNLGFTALKGGDLGTAKQALGSMQNDWFVKYGLISIARLEGDTGRAGGMCDEVLKKEPSHKAALFNCALVEYQNKKNYKHAIELVNKAAKAQHGEPGWDDRINLMESKIDNEAAKEKEAENAKKKQAADKAKADAAAKQPAPKPAVGNKKQ